MRDIVGDSVKSVNLMEKDFRKLDTFCKNYCSKMSNQAQRLDDWKDHNGWSLVQRQCSRQSSRRKNA